MTVESAGSWGDPGVALLPAWARDRHSGRPAFRWDHAFLARLETFDQLDGHCWDGATAPPSRAELNWLLEHVDRAGGLHDPRPVATANPGGLAKEVGEPEALPRRSHKNCELPLGVPPLLEVIPAHVDAAEIRQLDLSPRTVAALDRLDFPQSGTVDAALVVWEMIVVNGGGLRSLAQSQCVLESRFGTASQASPRNRVERRLQAAHVEFLDQRLDDARSIGDDEGDLAAWLAGRWVDEDEEAAARRAARKARG